MIKFHSFLTKPKKEKVNPDVRNRALIYQRILSSDPETARSIIVFPKNSILHGGKIYPEQILYELLSNLGTVSGVLHIASSDFSKQEKYLSEEVDTIKEELPILKWRKIPCSPDNLIDLYVDNTRNHYYMRMVNKTSSVISNLAIVFDQNSIGLFISGPVAFPQSIEPENFAEIIIPISCDVQKIGNLGIRDLRIAIRTNIENCFASDNIPVECGTIPTNPPSFTDFNRRWATLMFKNSLKEEDFEFATEHVLSNRFVYLIQSSDNLRYYYFQLQNESTFYIQIQSIQSGYEIIIGSDEEKMIALVRSSFVRIFS